MNATDRWIRAVAGRVGLTALALAPGILHANIQDAVHGAGNARFYFLPPLVAAPSPEGTFDGTRSPVVRVCELANGTCTRVVAEFSTTSGPISERVKVDAVSQSYIVNWHTGLEALDPAAVYRVSVRVGTVTLGHADVLLSGPDRSIEARDFVVLRNGSTLAIKFRIEQGALCYGENDCVEAVVGPSGGTVVAPTGLAAFSFRRQPWGRRFESRCDRRRVSACLGYFREWAPAMRS